MWSIMALALGATCETSSPSRARNRQQRIAQGGEDAGLGIVGVNVGPQWCDAPLEGTLHGVRSIEHSILGKVNQRDAINGSALD
jgi:hypothetical protein